MNHALSEVVEVVRSIIKGVNKDIDEGVKWKAPSCSNKGEYLATYNLQDTNRPGLVFHNPLIPKVESNLLEGNYKVRRIVYFTSAEDVKAKKGRIGKSVERFDQVV